MKSVLLAFGLLCAIISSGCTALHLVDGSTDDIRQQIVSAQLLKPGDKVRLVTSDKTVHEFRVTEIDLDKGVVSGEHESVLVSEVVGVATRELAVGKTVWLAVGIVGAIQLAAGLASIATLSP